jgi:glycosyltransferase involved in cell wall biosynthesis
LITPSGSYAAEVLIVTPHLEQTVVDLRDLLGGEGVVDLFCSNPVRVQGHKRGLLSRLRYYWFDPILTMMRLVPFVWRYRLVITYYHRNGYWLGLVRRIFLGRKQATWVWIGFAPNPVRRGLRGLAKEAITRSALAGHDLVVCNALPVVDMIKQRFPKVANRVTYVRWGGGGSPRAMDQCPDKGYIFCGGRTNRDFDTVLEAVAELRCPTVIVAPGEEQFSVAVPPHVSVHRDIPSEEFSRLMRDAGIVVVALKRQDISSGQVLLNQAMQHGKAVVVTAVAGMEAYVTDGTDALLVASGDVQDLKVKLALLLDSAERRKIMGRAARMTFERSFNSQVFARTLFEAVTRVRERRGADARA